MSRAVRPVETGMQDRGENVRHYLRETDSACPPGFGRSGKVSAFLGLQPDETSASRSSPRFLREQYRHVSLSGPKPGSVFRYADQFRADGIATKLVGIGHARFSPFSRVTAVGFDDFAFPVQHR